MWEFQFALEFLLFCCNPRSGSGLTIGFGSSMKIRPSILLCAMAIVGLLLVLALWSSKRPGKAAAASPQTVENPAEIPNHPPEPVETMPERPRAQPVENEGPIVFYGKLEDQSAEPVAGAEIIGTTFSHYGTTAQFSASSDDNGIFKLDAGTGERMEFMPQRPGYAMASTNNVELYTQLKTAPADSNKPAIIKMWKLQGVEPLSRFAGRYKLNASDTPVYFDFVTQTFVPTNGDIKITIKRPTGETSSAERPDWSVEIEAVEGGLMKITEGDWATTYWAPVDGYRQKFVLLMSPDALGGWSQNSNALFFVQTRHGDVYTKLSLKIGINLNPNDPVDLAIYGVANTNGSCNWEGDPGISKQE
jgi:hypothetical protein